MRYFLQIAYNGTNYAGWQRQPNALTVQEVLENALFTYFRDRIQVTGCGRTDTGVHASQYFVHLDLPGEAGGDLIKRINGILPPDIAVKNLFSVRQEAHARFDALLRSYVYHIHFIKNPFNREFSYFFPKHREISKKLLIKSAKLITQYSEFHPFCKSNSQVKTMECKVSRSEWIFNNEGMEFHISADRFLRGMVRLIVGMCLKVATGELELDEVKDALDSQIRLRKSWSVPPTGLFLSEVKYPYIEL